MPVKVTFLNAIGHGADMQRIDYGYDYFPGSVRQVTADAVTYTYTTTDFNGLGIGRVVQSLSRTSDTSVIRFFADDVEVMRVEGSRTNVGAFDSSEIEALMDQANSQFIHATDIVGTRFADNLLASEYDDTVVNGGLGDDTISGRYGADTIRGGKGSDWIDGGSDSDVLYGGSQRDTFYFESSGGKDRIADFNVMQDTIQFSRYVDPKSLTLSQTAAGVVVKAGYGITIILEGADLADVQANANFDFLM
jgi:Ca2+-binding RTX toxin-like protein